MKLIYEKNNDILSKNSISKFCDIIIQLSITRTKTTAQRTYLFSPTTRLYILGPFFAAYQNLPGRCLVCKHGSHVIMINIPKADWSSVKNKQLTATPC